MGKQLNCFSCSTSNLNWHMTKQWCHLHNEYAMIFNCSSISLIIILKVLLDRKDVNNIVDTQLWFNHVPHIRIGVDLSLLLKLSISIVNNSSNCIIQFIATSLIYFWLEFSLYEYQNAMDHISNHSVFALGKSVFYFYSFIIQAKAMDQTEI